MKKLYITILAVLGVALMLTWGCVEENTYEIDSPEEQLVVTPQGTLIPFTVNASTVADAPKVTVDYGKQQLFQGGDILRIFGTDGTYEISGDLTLQTDALLESGVFSGTLLYTGTGRPADDFPLTATLISEGNRMPAEGNPYANAIADLLDLAVQQFSTLSATSTYGEKTFALSQGTAFIEFVINMNGLSDDGKCKVRIQNKAVTEVLASCDTVTIKDGKARFTAAFAGGTELSQASVYIDGLIVRFGGSSGVTLVAGAAYNVTKTVNLLETPLSMRARESHTILMGGYKNTGSIQYSINGGEKTGLNGAYQIAMQTGDVVQFYDDYEYEHGFFMSNNGSILFLMYGNMMSLVSSTGYPTLKELKQERVFNRLFDGGYMSAFAFGNHPKRDILLPATTLSKECYAYMFASCKGLTRLPDLPATELTELCYYAMFFACSANLTQPMAELPATTLAKDCYRSMFGSCYSLQSTPIIRATTVADYCCYQMFYQCRALTTAPELQAAVMEPNCYYEMFKGCTALTQAPTLASTTLATSCYQGMFNGCTALRTAPELPATSLATSCYQDMFSGSGITAAPELSATTMVTSCYESMFSNCRHLLAAPELSATTLANRCYCNMFTGCSKITVAPDLPVKTLAQSCYESMFSNCTGLKTVHVLPATQLVRRCYDSMFQGCSALELVPSDMLPSTQLEWECYECMFQGCSSLLAAPELPADYVPYFSYSQMFSGCSSLRSAPELPATLLSTYCYQALFADCSSLRTPPVLPATVLTNHCYSGMFRNCTNLQSAPELPAQTMKLGCYENMFLGCTSLTTAPTLPASSLEQSCYEKMFYGCTNLSSVKCLATNISATDCVKDWLNGVAAAGTFTKATSMPVGEGGWPTDSASGIPTGWTVL